MKSAWRARVLGLIVAGAFCWGIVSLFQRQFASGEVEPRFSSMRAARDGTKLLYDSLGRLPGITVERNFLPLEFVPRDAATLLLVGVSPLEVKWNESRLLHSVEQTARRGNRVVLALDSEKAGSLTREGLTRHGASGNKKPNQAEQPPPLEAMWKVRLDFDSSCRRPHPLFIAAADGWRIREQAGDRILAVEREFGKGSVVFLVESRDFTNEAMVGMQRLAKVSGVFGTYRHIVFDEHHLGIAESGSIVAMARRFRMMGLAIGLALCAGLYLWRSASAFPPRLSDRPAERLSGRTSHAGLLTLLKRHIAPGELAGVCWQEWLTTNRRQTTVELRAQAEAILSESAGAPVEAAGQIRALFQRRGER